MSSLRTRFWPIPPFWQHQKRTAPPPPKRRQLPLEPLHRHSLRRGPKFHGDHFSVSMLVMRTLLAALTALVWLSWGVGVGKRSPEENIAPVAQLDQSTRLRIWGSEVQVLPGAPFCLVHRSRSRKNRDCTTRAFGPRGKLRIPVVPRVGGSLRDVVRV